MAIGWNSHHIQADSGSVVPVALEVVLVVLAEDSVVRVEAPEAGSVDLAEALNLEALVAQVAAPEVGDKNVNLTP